MKFTEFLMLENEQTDNMAKYKKMLKDNFDGYMSYFRGNGMFYYRPSKERNEETNQLFDEIWDHIVKAAEAKTAKYFETNKKAIDKSSVEYKNIFHDSMHSLMDLKRSIK